jgi:hypothetical protein
VASGFRWVVSLDSSRESTTAARLSCKPLSIIQNFVRAGEGGFRVAAPGDEPFLPFRTRVISILRSCDRHLHFATV